MTLAPRVVVVHRRTELDELLAHHGSRGQAEYFLRTRGRALAEVEARHALVGAALAEVSAAIPADWRRGLLERSELDRFLFAPDDVVVVVGQDGLVANVAKYLDGQPVIGVNPEPAVNPGVLVACAPSSVGALLASVVSGSAAVEARTMVEAVVDDGRSLVALNEVYVGHPSHQSARYRLTVDGDQERQSSSGVLVGTGTGATGWCRSVWQATGSSMPLPAPSDAALVWFVREAWPSPATGTSLVSGRVARGSAVQLVAETDGLVVFGDGMERDNLSLTWGQQVSVRISARTLRLVRAEDPARPSRSASASCLRRSASGCGRPSLPPSSASLPDSGRP